MFSMQNNILIFFFSFFFLSSFLDELPKAFFGKSYHSLPKNRLTKIGLISLDKLKNVYVANVFEDVICDVRDLCKIMCFTFFTVNSIHSIQEVTNLGN